MVLTELAQIFLLRLTVARHSILIYSRKIMGNLLYTIAVILIIIWLLGFLGVLGTGIGSSSLIHVLLVIAVIAIILRLIQGRGV